MLPQDIQNLFNSTIQDPNISFQSNQSGSQLTLVFNRLSDHPVNYEAIAKKLLDALRQSAPEDIQTIQFYGRKKGAKEVEWKSSGSITPVQSEGLSIPAAKVFALASPMDNKESISPKQPDSKKGLNPFGSMRELLSTLPLLGILALLLINTLLGYKARSVAWEYSIESVPDVLFVETMDKLGVEGWELVSARRAKDSESDNFSYECIFKRQKK
jgi:hypothetical protein